MFEKVRTSNNDSWEIVTLHVLVYFRWISYFRSSSQDCVYNIC